jgi:hypothetical protein
MQAVNVQWQAVEFAFNPIKYCTGRQGFCNFDAFYLHKNMY